MKRLSFFLILLCLTGLLAACGKNAVTVQAEPPTITTALSSTVLSSNPLSSTVTTSRTPTEAGTTYEDVLYDTEPIVQNKGEPLRIHWNPYLLSPLVEETYQSAFKDAIRALINRRLTVTFDTKDELLAVTDNLFYEFPPSALASWEADEDTLTLFFTYRYERSEHLEKIAAFGARVEEIIHKTLVYGDGEAEKALLLYHYIAYTVDYFKIDFEEWQTNAYYALTENNGICYSFSDAYNYLLRQVGVEAILVKGYRSVDRAPHGWSLIKVKNAYYHCDATWECSTLSGVGFYYFGMNDTRRANAIALNAATAGDGILQKTLALNAAGSQFDTLSDVKIQNNNWTIDREKRVIHYNGKEYSYDN